MVLGELGAQDAVESRAEPVHAYRNSVKTRWVC
jgi:hypothetical protein